MALLPLFAIGRGGLLAQEIGLTVAGNNIANANTPGYTRTRAVLSQEVPGQYAGVLIGRGVRAQRVEQVVDQLLEARLRVVTTEQGEAIARRDHLVALSAVANDLDDPSLATVLDAFFAAADGLARNPGGLAEREVLLARGEALADETNGRASRLARLQRDIDDRIAALVSEANDEIERLATLNTAIVNAEVDGQVAAGLRDERTLVLQSLARKVGIEAIDTGQLGTRISLANGLVLVEGGRVVHRLAAEPGSTPGLDGGPLRDLGVRRSNSSYVVLPSVALRGEIAGLRAVRDGELVEAATRLDLFASTLASAVNAVQQHPSARDLDGNATAGVPFFAGTTAATLQLALSDPRTIAAARSTQPGDAANALALVGVRGAAQGALNGTTLSGWLAAEQARLGQDAARAEDAATAADLRASQVRSEREAVSGVNLNEELANLLRFQHAFEASARVIAVADRVLDELVNLVR